MIDILDNNKSFNTLLMTKFIPLLLKKYKNICIFNKFDSIFATNKTHHASHRNSAPGWVFDFYRGLVL